MVEPLRILQTMAGPNRGGAEAFFVRLVRALRDAGVRQHVVVRRGAYAGSALRKLGIEPEELAFGGMFDLTTPGRLRRSIARFQPNIVLSWMNRATRFCSRSRSNAEFVHVGRLGGYYDLKYYAGCDHLIANTPDIANYVVGAGWSPRVVHYLPNFVDAAPAPGVVRSTLDTPDDVPLLLSLGRLHRNKGFDVLLEALEKLPEVYLWLVGSGSLAADLDAQSRALGIAERVRFLGWREDVASLYAAADVYVCPSRIEPLGNVVIEAWAHSRPVVAAAAAGPESLIKHGHSGLLVTVDDAEALAEAIQRVMNLPGLRDELVRGGHEAYLRDYTEQAVVQRYREFFESVTA